MHYQRVLFHMTADDKFRHEEKRSTKINSTNTRSNSYRHSKWNREATFIEVKAQFLVDGQTDDQLTFLDENSGQVHISNFAGCAGRQYDTEINYIVIGRYYGIFSVTFTS